MTSTSPVALPTTPDEVTADWLESVLSIDRPGLRVTALEQRRVIWGNATKVLVTADYEAPPGVEVPSRYLCAKGAFDPRVVGLTAKILFVLEANFYGDLGRRFSARLPPCPYAGVSEDGRLGVVVLEDIAMAGSRFVDPGETFTVDQVASGLGAQASWHAATWGSHQGDLPYVRVGTLARRAFPQFFSPDRWAARRALPGAAAIPVELDDPARILRAYQRLWEIDDASVHSLQHGDAHIGNTFVAADGGVGFLDWQTYCLAPWPFDVAYFVGGALTVEDRRAHERDLLRHYLDVLAGHGGPRMSVDEAWLPYVQHHLHGLTWLAVPAELQPWERSVIMAERHVAAVLDHEVFAALDR